MIINQTVEYLLLHILIKSSGKMNETVSNEVKVDIIT